MTIVAKAAERVFQHDSIFASFLQIRFVEQSPGDVTVLDLRTGAWALS